MIVLALGSNLTGYYGQPQQALVKAVNALEASGITIIRTSKIYITKADAYIRQPDFYNAIVTVSTPLPAEALLRVLKVIEARAGRRKQNFARQPFFHWRPRPLDLDIICYKSDVRNWKSNRPKKFGCVILPHPRAHERAFVLCPLAEVAPFWHHPVFGLTPAQLLKRSKVRETGKVLHSLEFER
jgi:2-amino-4-hydroxy-6-hydroxymethyldihydropteridine diphosphokinase